MKPSAPALEDEGIMTGGASRVWLWARAFVRRDVLTEISYRANFMLGLAGGLFTVLLFFFISQVVESAAPGISQYRGG